MEQLHSSSTAKLHNLLYHQGAFVMSEHHQMTTTGSYFFQADGLDIQKIFGQLYRNIGIILVTSIISCFIAFLYTLTIPPEYETSALLQVHQQTNSGSMIGRLGFKTGGESVEDTQEALIKTRYILEPVIIKNNLHINASPHYFHRFGAWKARNYHGTGIAKPFLGLTSYAWGGEEIKLKQFAVPENDVGKSFRLIAGKKNTYQVYSSEGK